MSDPKKKKALNRIFVILALGAIVFIIGYAVSGMKSGGLLRNRFSFDENKNVKVLNRLNADWVFPDEYSLEIVEVDGIAMEWIKKKDTESDKVILQLHGGAYTRSLKDNGTTYRRMAVQYAKISGASVLTVDYRVAPKHPYPAALEDALLAYRKLLDLGYLPEHIIIAGDSAGGGLALATCLYLKDHDLPMPAAVITMSPWTNLNYQRRKPAYVGDNRADDPYISPYYGEYGGFPPMLMQAGGDEILLNDTLHVAKKAEEAGVSVQQTVYPGMFHVFQALFPELSEANTAWNEVEEFITFIFSDK